MISLRASSLSFSASGAAKARETLESTGSVMSSITHDVKRNSRGCIRFVVRLHTAGEDTVLYCTRDGSYAVQATIGCCARPHYRASASDNLRWGQSGRISRDTVIYYHKKRTFKKRR